jgi:hypothetical protein
MVVGLWNILAMGLPGFFVKSDGATGCSFCFGSLFIIVPSILDTFPCPKSGQTKHEDGQVAREIL